MKAAVYYDIDDLRCEERPIPSIKPGEVLVKVKVCGLCGTDLSKIVNKSVAGGTVLGHEVV
jgi:L-iditol 2-dehydrogenase